MRTLTLSCAVLVVALWSSMSHAAQQGRDNARVRFTVMFTEGGSGASTLDVVFHRTQPQPTQAEAVVRNLLKAAVAVDAERDIVARAWVQDSEEQSGKKLVALPDNATNLFYSASAKTIEAGTSMDDGVAEVDAATGDSSGDVISSTLADAAVKSDCKGIPAERIAQLAAVGAEKRDTKRSEVVRAMRAFCKSEGVTPDRALKVCMSAISKAAIAFKTSVAEDFDSSPAAISRGLAAYGVGQCAKCHQASGKGGLRGPDLTDDKWLHCDGSVAGIRGVLVTGVPENKLKDQSRPFGMNPVTNFIDDDQQMTDLAVYVRSLSQN